MGNIKRITMQQLKVGMYVTQISDGWAAESNLKAQGLITREQTIDRFKSMGLSQVYIDISKGKDCAEGVPLDDIQKKHQAEFDSLSGGDLSAPKVSFEAERKNALEVRDKALTLVGEVMQDVKMGRAFDSAAVDVIVTEIADSLINNHNALQSLMRMRDKDQYLLEHSMNVAVLMGVLGRSVGIRGQELHEMVYGAFLHDVGKVRVPEAILYKPGRLEPDEWDEMKRHVDYGMEALGELKGLPPIAMNICAQHHERLDGTGYPFQLGGDKITRHGRMAAVVDVYDAVTADRVYHKGMEPTSALKKMLEWSGSHLDRSMVYQLIRSVSVYPAGTMVQLSSGHVAVVQEVNLQQPSQPRVKLVYDSRRKINVQENVISLADTDLYGSIKGAVAPELYGLDIRDYL